MASSLLADSDVGLLTRRVVVDDAHYSLTTGGVGGLMEGDTQFGMYCEEDYFPTFEAHCFAAIDELIHGPSHQESWETLYVLEEYYRHMRQERALDRGLLEWWDETLFNGWAFGYEPHSCQEDALFPTITLSQVQAAAAQYLSPTNFGVLKVLVPAAAA